MVFGGDTEDHIGKISTRRQVVVDTVNKTQAAWWHARASFRIASHAAAAAVVKWLYGFDKNVSTMVLLQESTT